MVLSLNARSLVCQVYLPTCSRFIIHFHLHILIAANMQQLLLFHSRSEKSEIVDHLHKSDVDNGVTYSGLPSDSRQIPILESLTPIFSKA